MSWYEFRILISTPEGEEHEHKDKLDANSYPEAILRAHARTINDIAKFRRDNGLLRMEVERLGHNMIIEVKKVSNE